MSHRRSMDEQIAAWVRSTTEEQGLDEKLGDSGAIAQFLTLIRARRRARTLDRSANRAMCDRQDDPAGR
jgi:hypothetical protein